MTIACARLYSNQFTSNIISLDTFGLDLVYANDLANDVSNLNIYIKKSFTKYLKSSFN